MLKSLSVGSHLDLPFLHTICDLQSIRKPIIQQGKGLQTYLGVGRIRTLRIKRTTEGPTVSLSDSPHCSFHREDGLDLLAGDTRKQVAG